MCNLSTLRILYIRTLRQKLVNEIDLVESMQEQVAAMVVLGAVALAATSSI